MCENWEHIDKDETLSLNEIFPQQPIIAYKRNPNISDRLKKAKVHGIRNKATNVNEQSQTQKDQT